MTGRFGGGSGGGGGDSGNGGGRLGGGGCGGGGDGSGGALPPDPASGAYTSQLNVSTFCGICCEVTRVLSDKNGSG